MTLMPLKKETEAAQTLMVHLRALHLAEDEEAVHNTLEGETNLFEALGEAVKQTGVDEAAIKALKDYQQTLRSRCERLKSRIEATRAAIAAAMDAAGLNKEVTRRTGLDPLRRQCYAFVFHKDNKEQSFRKLTLVTGIESLRAIAG